MIYIGIDPGTHTGFAVWDSEARRFQSLQTLPLHKAIEEVLSLDMSNPVEVVFEDARLRTWFGKGDTNAKLQGAGSIKRDCAIWEEFLTDNGIPYQAVAPIKGATKVSPEWFKMVSHYQGRTSEHSRDAAMLVIGR